MLTLLLLSGFTAFAGAGDPIDGHPNYLERELHLWSNAARVAPHDFGKDAEQGGCSASEWQSVSAVAPLRYNRPLGLVARAHSADMAVTGELSHDSSDGTTMVDRIQAVYGTDKAFAENVARGYPVARMAVLSGWMCSEGHRVNLLNERYDEVGHGTVDTWFTQDFGDGGWTPLPVNSATHHPQEPDGSVEFWTDVWHPQALTPLSVDAVVDGQALPLQSMAGPPGQGIWGGMLEVDGRCTPWFIEVRWPGQTVRWPETGSYAFGACSFDDVEAGWLNTQVEIGEGPFDSDWQGSTDDTDLPDTDADTDEPSTGRVTNLCSTSPAAGSWLLLLIGLGLNRRRVLGRRAL